MQLPKTELYPTKPSDADASTRVGLNARTLEFWDNWTGICNEDGVDVEKHWHRQRKLLVRLVLSWTWL